MFSTSDFKHEEKLEIAAAIARAEKGSSGEIRVHLSHGKKEVDLILLATAKFKKLKMDKTKLRNGVLLYLNSSLKKFAVFGDEGIHARVQQEFWDTLAKDITQAIREKDPLAGIVLAVETIGTALKTHFPFEADDLNELANDVSESS